METQKYCSVRVSGPKNQNGGFPQNLPGRFTSVCSVKMMIFGHFFKTRTRKYCYFVIFEENLAAFGLSSKMIIRDVFVKKTIFKPEHQKTFHAIPKNK